jgi:hypothetical protein
MIYRSDVKKPRPGTESGGATHRHIQYTTSTDIVKENNSMTADTSRAALQAHDSTYWRIKVYDYMITHRGRATLFETAAYFHKQKNELSGRFTELLKRGLIRDSGDRATDPQTGRSARIYQISQIYVTRTGKVKINGKEVKNHDQQNTSI